MTTIALDIETDTSPLTADEVKQGYTARGLDPRITKITAVSLYGSGIKKVLTGSEKSILTELEQILYKAQPDVIVTWNGAVFDLPFISDRNKALGLDSDLELFEDDTIVPKYDPTPGHKGGYTAVWYGSQHVDIAYKYKCDADSLGVPWSLKPIAEVFLDTAPVKVDRTKMHDLSQVDLEKYALSDARLTYELYMLKF